MASWKKILVDGDAVADNLATANLLQAASPRTYDLNGNETNLLFKNGVVKFSNSSNAVNYQFDNANGVFDARLANGIRLSDGNNGEHVNIKPKSETVASYTITLPNAVPGAVNKILESNATGELSWIDTPSGGTTITINTNADNRLITGSGTANTLNGESNLTFNGSELSVTGDVTTTGKISGQGSSVAVGKLETAIATAGSAGQVGLNAEVVTITTTTSLNAGYVYYLGSSAWTASDADAVASSVGLMGVATSASSATGMVIRGIVYVATDPGGSVGDVVYLSTATGRLTTTAVGTGDVSRVMGYKIGTNLVFFNPSQDWIEIS